jgi:predicted aspartyl protease
MHSEKIILPSAINSRLQYKVSIADTAGGWYETNGIIDTGAMESVISQNIADALKAHPYSFARVNTASEFGVLTPIYRARIIINDEVMIEGLRVTSGTLMEGTEFLIGMDVLNMGDLAVTNYNSQTCVSFRIPSLQRIDFVDAIKQPLVGAAMPSRNDPCPCGSGKNISIAAPINNDIYTIFCKFTIL